MLHTGYALLALVFERPRLDVREAFRQVGNETRLANPTVRVRCSWPTLAKW